MARLPTTGLLPPSSGTLSFRDQTLVDVAAKKYVPAWHRHFALVFQDGQLFPHLTVRDNLLVSADLPKWHSFIYDIFRPGRKSQQVEEQVDWALDIIGIGGLADALPSDLSHGQRKLVSDSRALAARPSDPGRRRGR